ncbi:heavy metal-associated domain-containing protein [Inquilinus sp. CAU 1745]|uniref:heavy-metal-associated domain-containing protein n=1 Tax=Inquilinus sp. CAU 1745 TaxID=3140369 RepID=UPI00325C172D
MTRAVEALPSVERAIVDLTKGEVTVEGDSDRDQAIRDAIRGAGYGVEQRLPTP